MFRLSRMTRKLAIVSLLTMTLAIFGNALLAQEAPRDSGTLIKPPTIKPPTAKSQATNRGTIRSRSRRGRRRARRVVRRAATTKPVAEKPRGIVGVSVDPTTDVPERVADTSPATTAPTPKRPISGGVLNGKAVSLPVPVYPPMAKAARASGTVVVRVLIDEEGNVEASEAVSGHPLLQAAAVEAARNAKFPPTKLSGQPVKVTGVITYNFVNE